VGVISICGNVGGSQIYTLWALEWAWLIMGVRVGVENLWALEWAWQMGVRVGVANLGVRVGVANLR